MGMNMSRFHERHDAVAANSGMEYADIPHFVVASGACVRLVGDFQSNWEHFVDTPNGSRPYYCDGPESDCPICQAANKLSFSDDESKQELGKSVKAKEKFYFACLDRSPAGMVWHQKHKKSYILSQNAKGHNIGTQLLKGIGDVCKMRQQQGQSDDPNDFDIILVKTGTGMLTKYGAQFTGVMTPLTEEELAYEAPPLDQISKITPLSDRQAVADLILNGVIAPSEQREFDVNKANASGPVQRQAAQPMSQRPVAAPPPAQPPRATVRTVGKTTVAAPAPAPAPAKLGVKLQHPVQPQYQSTVLTENADPARHLVVPCSDCAADMQIDMQDERDLQCHNCGRIYQHPNKG